MDRFFEIMSNSSYDYITRDLNTALRKCENLQEEGFYDMGVNVYIYYPDINDIYGLEVNKRDENLFNSLSEKFPCSVSVSSNYFSKSELIDHYESFQINDDLYKYI
ncbi:MAG: hypothetical protein WCO44_03395 [Bacteroidota bacterium]